MSPPPQTRGRRRATGPKRKSPPKPKPKRQAAAPVERHRALPRPVRNQAIAAAKTAAGAVGPVKSMMMNFLAPCSAHNFRWPYEGSSSTPASTRTGTCTLYETAQYVNSSGFTGTYCGKDAAANGTQVMYLFRNPLRAAVILQSLSTPATYNAVFNNGGVPGPTFVPVKESSCDLPSIYANAASSLNAPHGSTLFTGGLDARPEMSFFWLGEGDQFVLKSVGTGTPDDYWQLWKVDTPGSRGANCDAYGSAFAVTSIATKTITATEAGYYGLSIASGATTVTWHYTLDVVVAAGDVLAHHSIPYALQHAEYLKSVRLLSSSLLASNVASTFSAEGSIYGAVISDGTPFYTHSKPSDLSQKSDHYRDSSRKGIYTWLRPSENAFTYRTAITTNPNTAAVIDTKFALDDGCSYQAICIYSAGASPTSFPALDFLVGLSYCLEFKTDDPWRELEWPVLSSAAALTCLETVVRATSFTENPLHLSDIRAFVQKAGKFLRQHSVAIGGTLAMMVPEYAAGIHAVARLAQSRP